MKKTATLILLLSAVYSFGQSADAAEKGRRELISSACREIKKNYIDRNVAGKIDSLLSLESSAGNFRNLSGNDFAAALTRSLRAIANDKHFYVQYVKNYKPESPKPNDKKQREEDRLSNSLENFGFEEVRRLAGNIGYINFKGFAEPSSSEVALAAAMNFVSNTNSLIIDLRENRGGDNGMLLLVCSYFLDRKTKLYETYFRNKEKTVENWTRTKVLGKKYIRKPVYLLTSKNTFSAAEGLSYVLQSYKLATVIGEQTGGAANPVEPFFIDNNFLLLIPVGKITSAVTKKNWEQTGVVPDEKVNAKDALKKAEIIALNEILRRKKRTELTELELREVLKKLETE